MNLFKLLVLFCSVLWFNDILSAQSQYKVYFFLLEECKITQAYVKEINRLKKEYECDSIEFKAFFPSPSSEIDLVEKFMKEYQLDLKYEMDVLQMTSSKYDVTVMPEVVLYDESKMKVLYQGRIDNLFAKIGKRRSRATTHELNDCLESIRHGKLIHPFRTDAIGCFLTRL